MNWFREYFRKEIRKEPIDSLPCFFPDFRAFRLFGRRHEVAPVRHHEQDVFQAFGDGLLL